MSLVFLSIAIATYHLCAASNSSNKTSNHARRLIYDELLHQYQRKGQLRGDATHCSGALITPPTGVHDNFVLTAAHCLYHRDTDNPENNKFESKGGLHIEFGLTANTARHSNGIIECRAASYRFNAGFATEEFKSAHDYAIIKLRTCQSKSTFEIPTPFKIKNWRNGRQLARAGYRGGRELKAERHNVETARLPDQFNGMVALDGVSGGGDSGSAVYDAANPHYIRAVWTGKHTGLRVPGRSGGVKLAVKITPAVHAEINNMMKGLAGIPDQVTVPRCSPSHPEDTACWSRCGISCSSGYTNTNANIYIPCGPGGKREIICSKTGAGISDAFDDVFGDEHDGYDDYDEPDDYKESKNIQRIEYEMLLREMGLNNE